MLLDDYNSAMHSCVSRYFYFVLSTNHLSRAPQHPRQGKNRLRLRFHNMLVTLFAETGQTVIQDVVFYKLSL